MGWYFGVAGVFFRGETKKEEQCKAREIQDKTEKKGKPKTDERHTNSPLPHPKYKWLVQ